MSQKSAPIRDVGYLVVGLGGMGSAALYHLARLGVAPLGIEQFPPLHELGSSHGESRAFRILYHDQLYTQLAEAAVPRCCSCARILVGPIDCTVVVWRPGSGAGQASNGTASTAACPLNVGLCGKEGLR